MRQIICLSAERSIATESVVSSSNLEQQITLKANDMPDNSSATESQLGSSNSEQPHNDNANPAQEGESGTNTEQAVKGKQILLNRSSVMDPNHTKRKKPSPRAIRTNRKYLISSKQRKNIENI